LGASHPATRPRRLALGAEGQGSAEPPALPAQAPAMARPEGGFANVTLYRERYLQADAGTEATSFPVKISTVPAGAPSPKMAAETAPSSGET
jgi:hypothetical protein